MQNNFKNVYFLGLILLIIGCETVHQTTQQAGTYIGKGASTVGGATEGVTQGYKNTTSNQENPYSR